MHKNSTAANTVSVESRKYLQFHSSAFHYDCYYDFCYGTNNIGTDIEVIVAMPKLCNLLKVMLIKVWTLLTCVILRGKIFYCKNIIFV